MSGLMKTISVAGGLTVGILGFSSPAFALDGDTGDLIINEFNAVAPDKTLEDGEYDPAFGSSPVVGNGGNWIEFVVVGSNTTSGGKPALDIRGWTVTWESLDGTPDETGTLTFSQDGLWQYLRPGTIITFRRDSGSSTDVTYTPCPGAGAADWVINIDAASGGSYISMSGVNFHSDNDGFMAKITDPSSNLIQDWVGETENPDAVIWNGSGVNSREVGKLQADPSANASNYQDGNCSSFGAPNCWNDGANVQSFTALRSNVCP